MRTYKTSQVAGLIGIHANTVRLYEELHLIPAPDRQPNGYRIFNDLHIEQFKLARTALKVEVLQNGLRKKALDIIKTSASGDFTQAIKLTEDYLKQIRSEIKNAEEAIIIVKGILSGKGREERELCLTRKETAEYLQVTIDTLRNWELNGLLRVKRKKNGYRIHTYADTEQLKIIRSLRLANYSLSAILRMLKEVTRDPDTDIKEAIDTPREDEDIVMACDKLLTSLQYAEENALSMLSSLNKMQKIYGINPPL